MKYTRPTESPGVSLAPVPRYPLMNDTIHSPSSDGPPLETVHSVLKSRRRRFVVDVLHGREEPIDLRVLARAIAMRMPSEDDEETSSNELDRVATALHHIDLPQLVQAGVVEYDPEERVVEPTGADRLAPFLDAADSLS